MAFTTKDIRKRVKALLQDDAKFITFSEREEAITQAIEQVNHDKPLELIADIAGDGTQDYALPTTFKKQFSDLKIVETPTGNNPPTIFDRDDDWFLYEDPTLAPNVLRLRFRTVTPKTGETIRITFTSLYTVTLTTSDLNPTTFLAVVYKSLVHLFRALGARFAQTTDPTIDADAVDYGGRSQNFLLLAERAETSYKQVIGFGDEQVTAAQALGEADVIFSHGEDFLFHPVRTR